MSLKRILVLASGDAGDVTALAFAAHLAGQHDSVVEVVPVFPDSAADMVALGMALGASLSPEAVSELAAAERELQDRVANAARQAANEADVVFGAGDGAPRMSVLTRGLRPALALARQTALADLVTQKLRQRHRYSKAETFINPHPRISAGVARLLRK